jgi:hypothetical protein
MSPSIHAGSSRKGKAVEHLVAAFCVLGTNGKLNAWTSLVDDEGVDLVFQARKRPETISVQVKARLTTTKGLSQRQRFQSQVREATFLARPDFYMLFVVADPEALDIGPIWLIPSEVFHNKAPLSPKKKLKFTASAKATSKDMRSSYVVSKQELPLRLLQILAATGE